MTNLLQRIKQRGWWEVVIHPVDFQRERIANITQLEMVIRRARVEVRGWAFPYVGRESSSYGADYIFGEYDRGYKKESWRLYQSGQFAFYGAFWADWMDEEPADSYFRPTRPIPQNVFPITEAVYRYTEAMRLARNLSVSELGSADVGVKVGVHGIDGRRLWVDQPTRAPFMDDKVAHVSEYVHEHPFSAEELASRCDAIAMIWMRETVRRFGWDPAQGVLESMQQECVR